MFRIGIAIAAIITILDQASKWWVLSVLMNPPRPIPVTDFFTLVLAWNEGVSFSLLSGQASPYVFSAVAVAIVIGLLVWLRRAAERLTAIGIGLVVGGAIGNVIDRVNYGAVVDFLYFHAGEYYWPAFNLADSAITIGVGVLIIDSLFDRRGRSSQSGIDGR